MYPLDRVLKIKNKKSYILFKSTGDRNELKGVNKIDIIKRQLSILYKHLKHGSALHIEFKGSILQITLVTWCGEIFARAILVDDFITMTEEEIKEFVSEYF